MPGFRPRTPPPPPPPQPPRPPRTPSPPLPPVRPVSGDAGKKEPGEEPTLPPFTTLVKRELRTPLRPSDESGSRRTPPPPYPGLVITEAPRDPSPPPYGEVLVESRPIGVIGNYFFFIYLFNFLRKKILFVKVTYEVYFF